MSAGCTAGFATIAVYAFVHITNFAPEASVKDPAAVLCVLAHVGLGLSLIALVRRTSPAMLPVEHDSSRVVDGQAYAAAGAQDFRSVISTADEAAEQYGADELQMGDTLKLQAGCWVHQQPMTAALVHEVRAASLGSKPFPRRRLGLAAAAGLVLTAGILWLAPFRAGPQASHSSLAARAPAWMEARRLTSAPLREAPLLPQPESAPQARTASPPGSTVGHEPSEGHVPLGPLESLERQRLEPPPVSLTPSVTPPPPAAAPLSARRPLRVTHPPMGRAHKSCDERQAEIQAKLDAKSLTGYALTILARGDVQGHQVVGSCEGNTKKIVLNRLQNAP